MQKTTNGKTSPELTKQDLIEIYDQLNAPLYRYAVRLLGDSQLAEDCVAETFSRFLKIVQKGFAPKDNLKAYMYRIAHNWITDHYRTRTSDVELKETQMDNRKNNPATLVQEDMERQQVRNALLALPPEQLQVIMLRFYEDWGHQDTAKALGKSIEATRALQHRALNSLRSQLIAGQE